MVPIGVVLTICGFAWTVLWLWGRFFVKHDIYFVPTLTPGARQSGPEAADRARAVNRRLVAKFRRGLPYSLLALALGIALILIGL